MTRFFPQTRLHRRLFLAVAAASLVGGSAAFAFNEDEWYDPTDWFDGNNVESDDTYDYGYYDYDYDYGFGDTYDYGDNWTSYSTWGTDVWDNNYYDAGYWDVYDWDGDDLDRTYTFIAYVEPMSSGQNSTDSQSSQASKQKNQPGKSQQVAKLSGTIEALSDIRLKRNSGATGTYKIAKVRLDNGKTTVVNLGRDSQLKEVDLKEGASVQALGRRGRIGNETVFVAHKLKVDGRTIDANPTIRLSREKTQQASNAKTLQGTVAEVRKASSGSDSEHTLVNLELENGQSATVDFGPAADLEGMGVHEGQRVTVRGSTSNVNGRQILVPNLMKVDGQKLTSATE